MSNQDTEFTLTTGKILLIFFGLTVLCGVFFGLGYSLGKKSTPLSTNLSNQPQPAATKTGKPEPGVTAQPQPTVCSGSDCGSSAIVVVTATPATTPQSSDSGSGTAEVVSPQNKGYIVQVAAISKQEDADVLVGALRKKNYPVFVATSSGDKLLHVQVGPFSDKGEAESMRSRLSADGYNAILK